jgi:hypothetical protein
MTEFAELIAVVCDAFELEPVVDGKGITGCENEGIWAVD